MGKETAQVQYFPNAEAIAAGVLDLLILALFIAGYVAVSTALLLHVALVGAILLAGHLKPPKYDRDLLIVTPFAMLFAGPVGAFGWATSIALLRVRKSSSVVSLEQTRNTYPLNSASAEMLYECIQNQRTFAVDTAEPINFLEVIQHGALNERLAVIGVIAQNYHPDYQPILKSALRSENSALRAATAALATALRMEFGSRLLRALEAAPSASGQRRREILDELMTCLSSGFLDAIQCKKGRAGIRAVCKLALDTSQGDEHLHAIYCSILYEAGEYQRVIDEIAARTIPLSGNVRRVMILSLLRAGRHADVHRILHADHLSNTSSGNAASPHPYEEAAA